jgi:hypothetical protein
MKASGENKGRIIFGVILIVVLIASFAAYQLTGHMSIEDRYNTAVGLPASQEEEGGTFLGFSIEGNPLLYLIVLGIFCAAGFAAYRYFKV